MPQTLQTQSVWTKTYPSLMVNYQQKLTEVLDRVKSLIVQEIWSFLLTLYEVKYDILIKKLINNLFKQPWWDSSYSVINITTLWVSLLWLGRGGGRVVTSLRRFTKLVR